MNRSSVSSRSLRQSFLTMIYLLVAAVTVACDAPRGDSSQTLGGPTSAMVREATDTTPTCRGCNLVLDTLVRLQSSDSANFFLSTRVVFSPGLNRYYAAPLAEEGRIAEFDAGGTFLRLLGRLGDGPGELRRIRHLVAGPGDTLLMVGTDFRLVRLVLSSGGVLDGRLPAGVVPNDVLLLPGGEIIINSGTPTARSLVVLGADLEPLEELGDSVGREARTSFPDSANLLSARLGAGDSAGSFLEVTRGYVPRLRVWNSSLGLRAGWLLRRDWYPAYTSGDEDARGRGLLPSQAPPLPVMTGAWLDGDLAWVVASVPDPDWQQDDPLKPDEPLLTVSSDGIPNLAIRDWSRYSDGMIEAIDVESGRTFVRGRFKHDFSRSLGSGLLDQVAQDSLGDFVHTISRVKLQQ